MFDNQRRLYAAFVAFLLTPALVTSSMAGVALAAGALLAFPSLALAHCPNVDAPGGRAYSSARRQLSGTNARGIRAQIAWANPTTCTVPAGDAFSVEGINLCQTGACRAWVQVGWVKYQGWGEPHLYCEFQPYSPFIPPTGGVLWLQPTGLSHNTHTYKMTYDDVDDVWDCSLDGDPMYTKNVSFSSGTYLTAQGETNSKHAQIGKMAPNALLFQAMRYFNPSGNWAAFLPQTTNIDAPYGGEDPEPGYGQWQNWTNDH